MLLEVQRPVGLCQVGGLVIVLLVLLSHLDTVQVFTAVVALLAAAAALQHALYVATVDYSKRVVAVESDKEPLVAV